MRKSLFSKFFLTQVIVALTALEIDPDQDERFIKNGVSVWDALLTYYIPGGGFRHVLDGDLDGMSTEQGYYAMTAYYRMLEKKTSLYDMTDIIDKGGDVQEETVVPETTEEVTEPAATEETRSETPAAVWLGIIAACVGAIAVLLVNRKRIFGTDL